MTTQATVRSGVKKRPRERQIHKVLIANRGEIAVRIVRGMRELGIGTVAVFSDADRLALHVRIADQAIAIGPAPAAESYLSIGRLIDAARQTGADAIHPGYGFLAENAEFAAAVEDAGLVYIGPPADAIDRMGNKLRAHQIARDAGVPRIPSSDGAVTSAEEATAIAEKIGYPVMLKAAAGGGGKGMRVIDDPDGLASALELVRGEAKSAFGNDEVFIERAIQKPHHVEVQILGDMHGNCIHLGERDCSTQRRHQKVIEETPAPLIDDETRTAMGQAAVELAQAVDYFNAGTVEFLVDQDQNFYFLEMNTRLQVEHPVTELVTQIDIVKEQVAIACGRPLRMRQEDVQHSGHAMEFRIYAEDPLNQFMPSIGTIRRFRLPSGPGVRNDAGVYPGYEIPIYYDPMVAKLIVWGLTREEARLRARRALDEYMIVGVRTSLPLHRWIIDHPTFIAGEVDTGFLAAEWGPDAVVPDQADEDIAIIAATIQALEHERRVSTGGSSTAPAAGGSRWRFQQRPGGAGGAR